MAINLRRLLLTFFLYFIFIQVNHIANYIKINITTIKNIVQNIFKNYLITFQTYKIKNIKIEQKL